MKTSIPGALLAAGLLLPTLAAPAQQWKTKISTLTVVEPIEVPGKVLDPGTYVIKVVKTQSNRNIVQITNVDETKVFATTIATPNESRKPSPNTTFVYYPTVTGQTTKTLRTWFAPNDPYGQDLVYSNARATELARIVHEPVAAMPADFVATTDVKEYEGPVTLVKPVDEPKAKVYEPTLVAESRPAPAPASQLPRTASETPLVLGLGLLSLGGALALRAASRT